MKKGQAEPLRALNHDAMLALQDIRQYLGCVSDVRTKFCDILRKCSALFTFNAPD